MQIFSSLSDVAAAVGREIGVSGWITIDQDRINRFADATDDPQWIHVDVARAAKELPGGATIAHGYLTLALLPRLTSEIMKVENISMGINYGANKLRFLNMVPVNSRIRARMVLKDAQPKGAGLLLTQEITLEIDGQDKPALVAETLSLYYP